MWSNVRFSEREQGDLIGNVSMDWVVDDKILYTYTRYFDTTKTGDKNAFKKKANVAKDNHLAKIAKQDAKATQIETFMNT